MHSTSTTSSLQKVLVSAALVWVIVVLTSFRLTAIPSESSQSPRGRQQKQLEDPRKETFQQARPTKVKQLQAADALSDAEPDISPIPVGQSTGKNTRNRVVNGTTSLTKVDDLGLKQSTLKKTTTKTISGVSAFKRNKKDSNCTVVYTFRDIQRCTPVTKRRELEPYCEEHGIETWEDVQRCLNGKHPHPSMNRTGSQYTIHLIGERNSGTKWIVDEMQNCFPRDKLGIKMERDLFSRNKHFFQSVNSFHPLQQRHIVIAAFREPVEWVAAMIEKPYHMIEHQKGFDENDRPIPLEWEEFVNKPWTMQNRSKKDFKLLKEREKKPFKRLLCRNGMDFEEVIPCRFDPGTLPERLVRSQNPVYELKRGGKNDEPYANILELRSDKIVNHLLEVSIGYDLGGFMAVRFEDLVLNGTKAFLQELGQMIGYDQLPSTCKPQEPRPFMIGRRKIPEGLRKWVEDHLILRTERLLGYR